MTVKTYLRESFSTLLWAALIALVVRSFAYEPFNIPSESMVPGLDVGDYLFVSKSSFGYGPYFADVGPLSFAGVVKPLIRGRVFFTPPQRGDVVVFRLPTNTGITYIKRLIGLPNDKIQVKNGTLWVNGTAVQKTPLEPYMYNAEKEPARLVPHYRETLPDGGASYVTIEADGDENPADNTEEFTVPAGHYFMMGDNRDRSLDSRFSGEVGFVPEENLVGKAKIVMLSMGCNAKLWQVWKCPSQFRTDRFLQIIR